MEIMAQTMSSSISEKPVSSDLVVVLGFGVEFDIRFYISLLLEAKIPYVWAVPLRKCRFY